MAKDRKQVVRYGVNVEAGTITFQVLGAGSVTLDLEKTSEDSRQSALYNGFKQAGGDKAAIPRDTKTGLSATPAEKFARVKAWVDNLNGGGSWLMARQASEPLQRSAVFQAVASYLLGIQSKVVAGMDPEAASAMIARKWQDMQDDVLRTKLAQAEVAAEYARLTARGSSDGSLFDGLEG